MKEEILRLTREYVRNRRASEKTSSYATSGAVVDEDDIAEVVSAALDGWFTESGIARKFRDAISRYTGARYSLLVNSGSSANLVAITALKDLYKDPPSSFVVTCATAFPTTVGPLIQNGYRLYFVDIDPLTLRFDEDKVVELVDREDVAGVVLAHTLGFPFDEKRIAEACRKAGKWLVADCCDAFGSVVGGHHVGFYADAGTLSFFPAHNITTGEGGAVYTSNPKLFRLMQQYINWGRDCWCNPGQSGTCNKRFGWKWRNLPDGFDHKYTFTKIGYSLKMTELQAALGLSQMTKLPVFTEKRRANYKRIFDLMSKWHDLYWWVIPLPEGASPFGFYILCRSADIKQELVALLEDNGIATRPVFAGNIVRHPMMDGKEDIWLGDTAGSDAIMERGFWIGCWHGVTDENIAELERVVKEFVYG